MVVVLGSQGSVIDSGNSAGSEKLGFIHHWMEKRENKPAGTVSFYTKACSIQYKKPGRGTGRLNFAPRKWAG